MYECPDLFELEVAGTHEKKWVLYGADGLARIGDFSDGVFLDEGISFPLDYGAATYAGQTWSNESLGRRVHISWVRGMGENNGWEGDLGYHEMPFSQCMTLPCALFLIRNGEGYQLCRQPVEELAALREGEAVCYRGTITALGTRPLLPQTESLLKIKAESDELTILVGENAIHYSRESRLLVFPGEKSYYVSADTITLRLFVDKTTVELYFCGEISATYAMNTEEKQLRIEGQGQVNIEQWQLSSIWDK